jgi:phage-related minor tail protein
VIPQYQRAESQIKRPEVPMVGVSGVAGQRAALDAQGAAIDRQALSLEEQLNNLREAEALEKLMQVARGPKDIQRRQNAVNLAKAELATISAISDEEQQRLLFEAQSAQLISDTAAENKRLLDILDANKKLTAKQKEEYSKELDKNLAQTKQQIELDRELLKIAQERAFSERAAALDKEKAMFGTGFRAGYYGQAAQEYQAELARSGNEEQARLLAEKRKAIMEAPGGKLIPAFDEAITQLKELATWENVAVTGAASIGDAFGQAFRDISSGTMTAKEVLANFFQNMADRFSDMAGSMIADLIKIAFYKQIAQWMNIPLGAAGGTMGGIGGGAAAGLSDLPSAITSIAPVAANGAYFSNGIAAFARGGVVNSPTLFRFADGGAMNTGVMGEAGPEAILPLKRGSDGKLGVSGGDGGVNVTVNVDASGSKVQGDDANAGRLGQAVAAAVREEIVRQKRPGGLL